MATTMRASVPARKRSRSSGAVAGPAQKQARGQSRGTKYIGACHSSIAHTIGSTWGRSRGARGSKRAMPVSSLK